jgi:translation elongation factor EF-G
VSTQIFPSITPNLQVSLIGKSGVEIAKYFALTISPLESCDVALFIVSASDGISPVDAELWQTARELYIPSLILITELTNGEIDFEDMSAIAGRMLDPVQTPFLVLHDESGNPTALINLDTLRLSNYSGGTRIESESEAEHKVLVFEFREEFLESIEEFGPTGFQDGLSFPAIPFLPANGLGSFEIATLLNSIKKLPSGG